MSDLCSHLTDDFDKGISHLSHWYFKRVRCIGTELTLFYRKELNEHLAIDHTNGHDYDWDLYRDEAREAANRWLNETIQGSEYTFVDRKAAVVMLVTDYADEWRWADGDPRCPITSKAYYAMRKDVLDHSNFDHVEFLLDEEQEARREAADAVQSNQESTG